MSSAVHACRDIDPATECARTMLAHGVGFVPVVDAEGMLLGVITDRDLAIRVVAARKTTDVCVREVMSLRVIGCDPDEDIRAAEARMEQARVSRLPVITEGRCVGVLSLSDLVRVEEPRRASQLVREITSRESNPPATFG
jgi:CBS domain-containing protein